MSVCSYLVTSADSLSTYSDDLRRYAAYMCRHPDDAEDVAQSTLMKAFEHLEGFRGEASLRTWLHTIATNECRMLRRRKAPDSLDRLLDEAAAGPLLREIPSELPDPEQVALETDARRQVLAVLDQLPDRYQQVLLLKDGCGLRAADVARALDTTEAAAKSILHRARRRVRQHLEQEPLPI